MRAGRQLIGASLASLGLLMATPAVAGAADQWVFRGPAARPTDDPDPAHHAYTVKEAGRSPACTANFCVHWVEKGRDRPPRTDANGVRDGDRIPDFVEEVQEVAEYVYAVENGKLGWREPKSDGKRGGQKGKTDIYLKQLGAGFGKVFGYAAPDPDQAGRGRLLPRRLYGYLVLDNDYRASEFPGTDPLEDLAVTVAHEYAHILQFGYDVYQDPWLAESTAVWMEDQVYTEINDYLRYVRRWTKLYNTPLTATSIKEYGSAVWNHWLARRYGESFMRKLWAGAIDAKPGGFSVSTYNRAIAAAGGSDFNRDFAQFARDVAEWRTGAAFPEGSRYVDVARRGSLQAGARALERALNHTTFQLLRVHAEHGRTVVVRMTAPRGMASAVALVGRIGSERQGQVISRLRFKRNGGPMVVRLSDPGRFDRITAVLVNADTNAVGFSPLRLDWNYLTDTAPFRVRADVVR